MKRGSHGDNSPEDSGTWYLRQAADGAWQIHARSHMTAMDMQLLAHLRRYPAVVTPNGNLFHLGTPLGKLRGLPRN